jgi:hypothetical protein
LPEFGYIPEKPGGKAMPTTIVSMTRDELARMVSTVVEEKLIEMFGDPDDGLVLKDNLRKRLVRQRKSVAKGERGEDFAKSTKRLRL